MKTLGLVTRTVLSLLIVVGAALAVYWMGKSEVPTRPPIRGGAPMVRTAVAANHDQGIRFEVDGVVVPFRQIEIAAQVGGRIAFKSENCRTGRAVQEGELLLRIVQSDYKLDANSVNIVSGATNLESIYAQSGVAVKKLQGEWHRAVISIIETLGAVFGAEYLVRELTGSEPGN